MRRLIRIIRAVGGVKEIGNWLRGIVFICHGKVEMANVLKI